MGQGLLREKSVATPSVMDAKWPVAGEVDKVALAAGTYLEKTLHTARVRIDQGAGAAGGGRGSGSG